jgi:hypothetical protein
MIQKNNQSLVNMQAYTKILIATIFNAGFTFERHMPEIFLFL